MLLIVSASFVNHFFYEWNMRKFFFLGWGLPYCHHVICTVCAVVMMPSGIWWSCCSRPQFNWLILKGKFLVWCFIQFYLSGVGKDERQGCGILLGPQLMFSCHFLCYFIQFMKGYQKYYFKLLHVYFEMYIW